MKKPKTTYLIVLFLSFYNSVTAQDVVTNKLLENAHDWHDGSVMTADGIELHGVLKFNDNIGLLSYESGNISKTFTPKSVAGFEFFDEASNKQRIFYSLPYREDPKENVE